MVNIKKIVLGLIIISLGTVLAYVAKKHSPNKNDEKLNEVRQLYSQLLLPTDFKEIGSSFMSKTELAMQEKYFSSPMTYEDLKAFLNQRLNASAWTLVQERSMTDWGQDLGGRQLKFRKGEYWIVIEYAGEKATDQWDYAITVEWKKQG